MSKESFLGLRGTLINLVLGTDMAMHFVNLKEFSSLAEEYRSSSHRRDQSPRVPSQLLSSSPVTFSLWH